MSVDTRCPSCGAEHDMRHDGCPVCSIEVELRHSFAPYALFKERGHLPFEMFGEKFAATKVPNPLNDFQRWRVSHLGTGAGLPNLFAQTPSEAVDRAKQQLVTLGAIKFKAAVEKIRAKLQLP